MKLNEYQKLSKRTLPNYADSIDRKLAISNYSMGLAGESGEVIDILKKSVHHGHELDLSEVTNELGDVLHYAAGLATMCGLSLEEVANSNITKLQRRYPKGFSKEASIKRLDVEN